MSPGWEKDKDSVCNVCECFHARNRVPTVPEKQVARWVGQKSRPASLDGASKP